MNRITRRLGLLTLSAGVLLVNGPNPRGTAHAQTAEHSSAPRSGENAPAKIARAMSAGPAEVAKSARIVDTDEHGTVVLREGNNGFTCMPGNPRVVGDPPMCADAAAMQWSADFKAHKAKPTNTAPGIIYMLAGATQRAAAPKPHHVLAFPRYTTDHLVLSIREAAEAFRLPCRARLGLDVHPQESVYAWQSIKAMTRRYAEGFDDGYPLRPASNLLTSLSNAVSRFLETTTSWDGDPTPEEKRETIDIIKAKVSDRLRLLSARRLREQPQPQWHTAYAYRGGGSTRDRRNTIEGIYARWVPIPSGSGDVDAEEFLEDVKGNVLAAIDEVRREVEAQRAAEVA